MKPIFNAPFRGHQRYTILLIGNNVGPLKRIAFALQHRNHTVLWAQYGREALRSVRLECPDLVVCEIDLPDLDGIEVCGMVKSAFLTKTPVVLVADAEIDGEDAPRATQAGADDTIIDLSDMRYILARLEWLAARAVVGRENSSELTASIDSRGRGVKRGNQKLRID